MGRRAQQRRAQNTNGLGLEQPRLNGEPGRKAEAQRSRGRAGLAGVHKNVREDAGQIPPGTQICGRTAILYECKRSPLSLLWQVCAGDFAVQSSSCDQVVSVVEWCRLPEAWVGWRYSWFCGAFAFFGSARPLLLSPSNKQIGLQELSFKSGGSAAYLRSY